MQKKRKKGYATSLMNPSILKRLFLGSGLQVVTLVVTVAIGLVLTPYIIHTLGNELYGVWTLATTFVGMFSLLDIGLNSAVGRFAAARIGVQDYEGLNRYLNTGFYIFRWISFVALFIAGAAAWYIFQSQEIPHANAVAVVIIILGAQFAILLPLQAICGLLTGALRYDIATSITILFKILSSTAVFLTLYFGGGIVTLAITGLICTMLERSVTLFFARREVPQAEIAFKHFDKKTVKELFTYGVFVFIYSISAIFRFQIPAFIIGSFVGLAAVTHYSIAGMLTTYFISVTGAALGVLTPVFARQQANNDYQAIRKTLRFTIKCSVVLSLFVWFGMVAWGYPFIERWMGADYLVAYPWLVVLVTGYLAALVQSSSVHMLYGLAQHHVQAYLVVAESILNLVLGLILVQFYGCLGVAIAAFISIVLLKLFVYPFFVCHVVKEPVSSYYWGLLRSLLICAGALVLPLIVTYYLVAPNYLALVLTGTLSAILYLPVVFVVFTRSEQKYVWDSLWKKHTESQA